MKTIRLWVWAICVWWSATAPAQVTQQVTALQYYLNTDPGVGLPGNGAIIPVTPAADVNQVFNLVLPATLSQGFHQLYMRVKDEYGRWSMAERRMFYIADIVGGTRNLVAYQYYFNADPGTGSPGNGAIVPISSTSSFNSTVAISMPGSLGNGFHQLYIRTKDDMGRWSIAERRMFYISDIVAGTRNIVAYQFYFNTDPGAGVSGNGAIVPVTSTADYNATVAITIPGSMSNGFHQLYIRTKDDKDRWSLAERRMFYISDIVSGTRNIIAYQYFFDSDPGTGLPGTGAIVPVTSAADYTATVSISLPGSLSPGLHQLYIRTKDDLGRWSVAERRMFYISDVVGGTRDITALEYFFDADPGVRNANPFPVATTADLNTTVMLNVPCLSAGTHYLFIRAKDTSGRWSIIDKDTLTITSGITPSVVSPTGPLSICTGGSVVLSTTPVSGVTYQWVESGIPIPGATNPSYTATAAGSYALRSICGSFVLSNTVVVAALTQNTYYADADNDGYGNAAITLMDCVQPSGYVTNDDDCNDGNASIHPNAPETCNLIDDDCDGTVDEGVQTTFYADADNDGYGNPAVSQLACSMPSGFVANADDCNDANININPGATETCNTIDDDCDGSIDEGLQITFYADADNDGFGNPSAAVMACAAPSGYVTNNTDCDDALYYVYPGAPELCNGIDDDCDSQVDEGYELSVAAGSISSSNGNSFCAGGSTMLSVVGGMLGSGADWYWYEGVCGSGTPMGTGVSLSVSPAAGTHTYYVRAEGTCNASTCVSYMITILTPPSASLCPAEVNTNNAVTICNAAATYSIVFSGNPAPALNYTLSGATAGSGTGTASGSIFNVGETSVLVTAMNVCGSAECNVTVTVDDAEDPVFNNCPESLESEIESGQWGAHVSWSEPIAIDNCEMDDLVSTHQPGDFFIVGQTVVVYTATDVHGNTSTCAFMVSVSPPQVVGPVNVSLFANDIQFSDPAPDPGTNITVFATVHNTSNSDAAPFICRLYDQYAETYYPDIAVTGLEANEDTTLSWVISTPVDPAFVPIQVSIDYPDDLDESNELDNQAVRPYLNGEFNFGGRIVVIANAIPTTTAGSMISICGKAYYADTSVPLVDSSVAGAQVSIQILETGQVLNGTTNSVGDFCLPYLTPNTSGLYHFLAEVTDFTLTGDTTGSFILTDPIVICPKDLSLGLELSGTFLCNNRYHIVQGQTLTGLIRVYNACESVTQPTTLFVALPDGTPVPGPFTVPALAPGATYDVALPAMTFNAIGWTYISATVDYYNVVMESSELNNSRLINIQVHPPMPDIVPQPGNISTAYECVPGFISFVIRNTGGAPTGVFQASLEVYFGTTLETTLTQMVPDIPGLCDQLISFQIDPAFAGIYTFQLTCDGPGDVTELSETNNELVVAYGFNACEGDLIVDGTCGAIDVKPADPQYPGTISIFARIINRGTLAVTTPFSVEFDVAGSIFSVAISTPIPAGGVKDVSVSVPAPPHGNNTLVITADADLDVVESNEFNNAVTESLCWDFITTNQTCPGDKFIRPTQMICQPLTLRTGLFNAGLYEATAVQTKFEIQGPGLPPGWFNLGTATTFLDHTCSCPVEAALPNAFLFPQLGAYTIRVTADPNYQYTECQEGNNQILVAVQVVESPDYAVYSQYIAPSDINPDLNEAITFNLTYANEGCTGLNPMELWLEIDHTALDSVPANALPSGSFTTYAMAQSWSSGLPGLHVARSVVDHDHQISETNEMNNEATRGIVVGDAPDFNITLLDVSDDTPQPGQTIVVDATVINEGRAAADGTLRFYAVTMLNQEILIAAYDIHLASEASVIKSFSWFVPDFMSAIIARVSDSDPQEYDYTDNERMQPLNAMSLEVVETDVACAGLDLGSLETQIAGGLPPYFIQWSNGFTGPSIDLPSGTYSVTVTDATGHILTSLDTIMDLAIPVTWYQDADNDGFGNPNVSDYDCLQPQGYVGTGTDCDDTKVNVYPDAPELQDGLDNDCDGLIDEGFSTLNVEAGDCETVYLGYVPNQCYTLSVTASGGTTPYTYIWSNGATISSTSVCPEETAIYSVTVTDHNGFTAEDNVTVQVIDIRCGNNNNKVLVCHIPPGNPQNVQMICIAPSAVQAHLDHGCYVGICDAPDPCAEEGQSASTYPASGSLDAGNSNPAIVDKEVLDIPEEGLTLVPNPADDYVMILYPLTDERRLLSLYDVSGRLIERVVLEDHQHKIQTGNLAEGIYVVQIQTPTKVMVMELVIAH